MEPLQSVRTPHKQNDAHFVVLNSQKSSLLSRQELKRRRRRGKSRRRRRQQWGGILTQHCLHVSTRPTEAHLACVLLLLCFTCSGLCADMEQELGEQLLSSLLASKLKQASKQSAPYWRLTLDNLCRLADGLRLIEEGAEEAAWWRRSGEEAGEEVEEEEEEEGEQQMRMREWSNKSLEELYSVRHICRALLHSSQGRLRYDSMEYAAENGGGAQLKRKSPYILKRQATHAAKSRRPYILKRSEIY
ncbi:neurotensin/neuromedin N isoform X2 [Hippocampus zosterae]|uniref:neurotensin/neuromedin N isoform X2 n=1 Tax=Hippocampus zosterae TaxID=109293 RepID=UPI00223D6734|nr:neurotensin/neuromedin N isoform X2 [Hippocampus zosterae]